MISFIIPFARDVNSQESYAHEAPLSSIISFYPHATIF